MRKIVAVILTGLLVFVWCLMPAEAQRRPMRFIRDAEIEHIIRGFAEPIFQVAGIEPQAVSVYLVQDPTLNAFVAGGQNMFLHTGLLLQAEDAGQLLGVMAHESGHISGGHLARGAEALEQARTQALITTILGLAAAAASGQAGVAAAAIGGGQGMAERGFLSYTRSMENAADQAALSYLDRAGISSEGMLSFLEKLEDQELVPQSRQVEYVRTHPMTRDRVDAVRSHVSRSRYTGQPLPAEVQEDFRRMQAKLLGFLEPRRALQRYPEDDDSVAGRYGRAIALYRQGQLDVALAAMDELIAEEPDNPFFLELKGQMLLEHGRLAEAKPYYEQASRLYPREPLLLVPLAQIKLDSGDEADVASAIDDLTEAVQIDDGMAMAWRLLATAYGRSGDLGMAAVALAEEALAQRDPVRALQQVSRAEGQLPEGSPGWLRLEDIRRQAQEMRR